VRAAYSIKRLFLILLFYLARYSFNSFVISRNKKIGGYMLKWAIIFFVISVVAGVFGFTNVAEGARTISRVFFAIFLTLFLIILIFGLFLGQALF
jgi:uncharacterized membrane protein YtjA (UPF0391 family)